jgi:hypothetical protein
MSRPVHPLGFQTDRLPFAQLRALADALTTVGNVISGLRDMPLFTDGDGHNEAGDMLENLRVNINCEIDDIRVVVEQRPVTAPDDADAKFDIIMSGMLWSGEQTPAIVAKLLATLSADLSWQLLACQERAA